MVLAGVMAGWLLSVTSPGVTGTGLHHPELRPLETVAPTRGQWASISADLRDPFSGTAPTAVPDGPLPVGHDLQPPTWNRRIGKSRTLQDPFGDSPEPPLAPGLGATSPAHPDLQDPFDDARPRCARQTEAGVPIARPRDLDARCRQSFPTPQAGPAKPLQDPFSG